VQRDCTLCLHELLTAERRQTFPRILKQSKKYAHCKGVGIMTALDADVSNAVQTELKLYLTQQLNRKGYLSDKMCADATEIILKGAKKLKESKKSDSK